jgi:hypothetical protein
VNVFILQYPTSISDIYDKSPAKKARDEILSDNVGKDWLQNAGLGCNPSSLLSIINSTKFDDNLMLRGGKITK